MSIFDYIKFHTKKKNPNHKVVYVKWIDSYTLDDVWTSLNQIENKTYEVETVRLSSPSTYN